MNRDIATVKHARWFELQLSISIDCLRFRLSAHAPITTTANYSFGKLTSIRQHKPSRVELLISIPSCSPGQPKITDAPLFFILTIGLAAISVGWYKRLQALQLPVHKKAAAQRCRPATCASAYDSFSSLAVVRCPVKMRCSAQSVRCHSDQLFVFDNERSP